MLPMTAKKQQRFEITISVFRKAPRLLGMVLVILLLTTGTLGYYFLEAGPWEQQRARVQPLLEAGLSLDGSIRFDQSFSDQSFRWPWQENKAYHGDEIKFAEMWLKDNLTTEVLLNYYYCASSNYNSLVWLFGSLKRSLSFWDGAVRLVVHGDINNDGISNYDSLLGPNADVLDTITPDPVTVYALEKNLSKEAIKQLKPFEADGQMTEWEKEIVDLVANHKISESRLEWIVKNLEPNPATIYALEQNLSNAWIEWINPLGKDGNLEEWEKYIIDHLAELPSVYVDWAIENAIKNHELTDWERYFVNHINKLPDCFVEEVLKDKHISYEDWMQAQFLARFGREYLDKKDEEWINNPDLDGDGFTNEFEANVSFTDPYVCNERYAILAYSEDLTLPWKAKFGEVEKFLTWNASYSDRDMQTFGGKLYGGFKEDNIYKLYDENMTFHNFKLIIDDLVNRSNENDIILFLFAGHGERNLIYFSDRGVSYGEIEEELTRLKAKVQILIVDACYSGSAITYLKSEKRIVIASSRETEETYGGMILNLFNAMQNSTCDLDNNKYCSMLESFYGAKTSIESKFGIHPQLSNEILAETYLMELYLGE